VSGAIDNVPLLDGLILLTSVPAGVTVGSFDFRVSDVARNFVAVGLPTMQKPQPQFVALLMRSCAGESSAGRRSDVPGARALFLTVVCCMIVRRCGFPRGKVENQAVVLW